MTDEDVSMVVGCLGILRDWGMKKEDVIPYYEKLLEHHKITVAEVNEKALFMAITGRLPPKAQAVEHLKELFPELKVV